MAADIQITLLVSLVAREVQELLAHVPKGTTAAQALRSSGLSLNLSDASLASLELHIWGRKVPGSQILKAHDRIELLRPLLVDPKRARRERFEKQGAKKAGLFKTRRVGGKAGY